MHGTWLNVQKIEMKARWKKKIRFELCNLFNFIMKRILWSHTNPGECTKHHKNQANFSMIIKKCMEVTMFDSYREKSWKSALQINEILLLMLLLLWFWVHTRTHSLFALIAIRWFLIVGCCRIFAPPLFFHPQAMNTAKSDAIMQRGAVLSCISLWHA